MITAGIYLYLRPVTEAEEDVSTGDRYPAKAIWDANAKTPP